MCSKGGKNYEKQLTFQDPLCISVSIKMFNDLERLGQQADSGYPPYNITKVNDDKTVIELAVAGFSLPMLDIEVKDGILSITGNSDETKRRLNISIKVFHLVSFVESLNYLNILSYQGLT